MHRDTKLGLALGILVIGFAAAFCFPREPVSRGTAAPELEQTLRLDESIEFLPIRAYKREPARITLRDTEPQQPEPVSDESDNVATSAPPAPPIAPIGREAGPSPLPRIEISLAPLREEGAITNAHEEVSVDSPAPAATVADPAHTTTYTVKSGDTLSGIAHRFLGAASRYREVYEANRDVLANPDDVRMGMQLTIPLPGEPSRTQQPLIAEGTRSTPEPPKGHHQRYTVSSGETWESIATREYGRRDAEEMLRQANPEAAAAGGLKPGTVLILPSPATQVASEPQDGRSKE